MSTILIVDDDCEILALLQRFFLKNGHEVDTAESGSVMRSRTAMKQYDLVILDVMLPGEDGLSLCRMLRETSRVAIIMLTALSETSDRIVGLELGADDYVTKPFDARELLARVRAVLRRRAGTGEARGRPSVMATFSGWELDIARRELRAPDKTLIPISGGEFNLLLAFIEHPRRVLSREQLLDFSRASGHDAYERSIDVQISRLRHKIARDEGKPDMIRTIRNGGYMFTSEVVAS